MNLSGKTTLITGGTKGIGAAAALLLASKGAKAAIVGRNLTDRESTDTTRKLAEIAAPGTFAVLQGDMASPDDCRRVCQETAKKLGDIDILIHSAGGPVPGGLLEVSQAAWNAAFDVHVHAIFHLCRAVVPAMKQKREGVILLVSSSAGKRAIKSNIAYQAVKGAIPHITRALAYELADFNIRANCVAPGVIRTAFHDQMPESVRQNNLANRIPLHKEGTPDQVATLILEMITNDYITGESFSVDGGLTMRIC